MLLSGSVTISSEMYFIDYLSQWQASTVRLTWINDTSVELGMG